MRLQEAAHFWGYHLRTKRVADSVVIIIIWLEFTYMPDLNITFLGADICSTEQVTLR